jgi:capsid assembly protease
MKSHQILARSLAQREIWAILPEFLQDALTNLSAESTTDPRPMGEGAGEGLQAVSRPGPKSGNVARVPIFGAISHRDSFFSLLFGGGGATVERLTQTLRGLASEPSISTVLLEFDSPGGTVAGVPELAAEVRALAASKHVVSLVNSLAASAAYWIASQADEIIATPEALVGSIGVFTLHQDFSKALEEMGVKTTYISAGKYKTEANPTEPLTPDAQDHLQGLVNAAYNLFVADVARGRKTTPGAVRSDFGQGRVVTAMDAKDAHMIDRIATADETIKRLMGRQADDLTPPIVEHIEGERLANLKRRLDLAEL